MTLEGVRGFLLTCKEEERGEVHQLSRPRQDREEVETQARVNPSATVTPEQGLVVVVGGVTVTIQGPVDLHQ